MKRCRKESNEKFNQNRKMGSVIINMKGVRFLTCRFSDRVDLLLKNSSKPVLQSIFRPQLIFQQEEKETKTVSKIASIQVVARKRDFMALV